MKDEKKYVSKNKNVKESENVCSTSIQYRRSRFSSLDIVRRFSVAVAPAQSEVENCAHQLRHSKTWRSIPKTKSISNYASLFGCLSGKYFFSLQKFLFSNPVNTKENLFL